VNFSTQTIDKARRLLTDDKVSQDAEHPAIWHVASSSGIRTYRVASDYLPSTRTLTWISCTCPHGEHQGAGEARCYHVAAVLLRLKERGGLTGLGRWVLALQCDEVHQHGEEGWRPAGDDNMHEHWVEEKIG
jgi:hypothetical protein